MNLEQIDTSTTAGKIQVMELAQQGRQVACSVRRGQKFMRLNQEPSWSWEVFDYAIISEPVGPEVVWVEVCDRGIARSLSQEGVARKGHVVVHYIRADLAGEGK